MLELAATVSLILTGVALLHVVLTGQFYFMTRRSQRPGESQYCPKAAVVISLRGGDAYLADALRGLLEQDYPDYRVLVVVDDPRDPAYAIAQRAIDECGAAHARLSTLQTRRRTCSLKCNALAEAAADLDEAIQVVAFMDSDVVPHATWLRELVAPLEDSQIGATTGNRWYLPRSGRWGSAVRSAWNGSAVMQMTVFKIAWGGTLAIRTSLLRDTDLIDRWKRSFNDDIVVAEVVRRRGLKLYFVPTLVMVNQEETTWKSCLTWVTRQLFHTRFYLRTWQVVATLGLASMLLILAAGAVTVTAFWQGHVAEGMVAIGGLVCYFAIMSGLWLAISFRIHSLVPDRVNRVNGLGLLLVPAVVGAHIIYGIALCSALIRRRITWRGVTYYVRGPWQVEMLHDPPQEAAGLTAEAGLSI